MTTTAYLRVSTDGQDLQKNKHDILEFANERALGQVQWIEETASGRITWRDRKIAQIIDDAQEGDTLIVSELSRLGRSMLEVMEILSVATNKGLKVYALKGNWVLDGSIQSKMMAMLLALFSEIERDFISMRTKEGLAALKRQGKKLGRPSGVGKSMLDEHMAKIKEMLSNDVPVTAIARKLKTSPANLHRWMKAHDIRRGDAS